MIWKACFDESYDDELFIIAGVLGTMPEWDAFTPQWEDALSQERAIPYFTKKDAGRLDSPKSVFNGFSRPEVLVKESVLDAALGRMKYRLVVSFNKADFEHNVRPCDFFGYERYKDPHLLAFYSCLTLVKDHMEEMEREQGTQKKPVLIFDHMPGREGMAREIYEHHRKAAASTGLHPLGRWLSKPGGLFMDDYDTGKGGLFDVGLQAADYAAWHYRDAINRNARQGSWTERGAHGALVRGRNWRSQDLLRWNRTLRGFLYHKAEQRNAKRKRVR